MHSLDFPGGPVVKNLPANAGDVGAIPGMGRYHMPLLIPYSRGWEPQLLSPHALEPVLHNERSYCSEKPVDRIRE